MQTMFWVVLMVLTAIAVLWSLRKKDNEDTFLVSDRSISGLIGLFTVAVAWTWAPALLVSSQKSFESGLGAFLWFAVPNVAALVLFYFLSKRMHQLNPEGYTLPEFIKKRSTEKTQKFYIITIFLVQLYAIIVNLLGSTLLLQHITGLPKYVLIPAISLAALIIVLIKGLFTSIRIDVIKAALIIVLGVTFVSLLGLFVTASFAGKDGTGWNIFNANTVLAFGIPTAISLLAAVTIDQQQWQRSFALRKTANLKVVYFGAAIFFSLILVCMALPGFVASSKGMAVSQSQIVAFEVMNSVFSPIIVNILFATILISLIAVICAALNAASSIWVIDVKKMWNLSSLRLAMVAFLIIASAFIFIPGLQVAWLQMFVGSFRSALLIPTFLILFKKDITKGLISNLNKGMLIGMIIGPLIFLVGLLLTRQYLYTVGSLFPIVTTLIAWLIPQKNSI